MQSLFIVHYSQLRFLRKLLKILSILSVSILALFALLYALIVAPPVQRFLVSHVVSILNERCGAKVQISAVRLTPLSSLSLRDVLILDSHSDTILSAPSLSVSISPLRLLTSRTLTITSVTLSSAHFHLAWDQTSRLNLYDLIDAFRSNKKKKKSSSRLVLQVSSLSLRDCRYTMRRATAPLSPSPNLFNHWDLDISHINADISLYDYHKGLLDVQIHNLSATEKSGVRINLFTAHLQATGKNALITDVRLLTPLSSVTLDSITADYSHCWDTVPLPDGTTHRSFNVRRVPCSFILRPSHVALVDASHWAPVLASRRDEFDLSARFSGTLSDMHLTIPSLVWNEGLDLVADIELTGLPSWRTALLDLRIQQMRTSPPRLQDLLARTLAKPFQLPEPIRRLGSVTSTGSVSGPLSSLSASLDVSTDLGNLRVDAAYSVPEKNKGISYQASVASSGFNLGKMLGTPSLGTISTSVSASATNQTASGLHATFDGIVHSIVYKDYAYHDISFDGSYQSDFLNYNLKSRDPNATADLSGQLALSSVKSTDFNLKISAFRPYSVHLIKSQPSLNITTELGGSFVFDKRPELDILASYIRFSGEDKSLRLSNVSLRSSSDPSSGDDSLLFSSPVAKAQLTGKYSLSQLLPSFKNYLSAFLPSVFPTNNSDIQSDDYCLANLEVSDFSPNALFEVFGLDMAVSPDAHLSAFLDERHGQASLNMDVSQLSLGKRIFSNTHLSCRNDAADILTASLSTVIDNAEAALMVNAFQDQAVISVNWNNPQLTFGSLSAQTTFSRPEPDSLRAVIDVNPSTFMITDDLWRVHRSRLATDFSSVRVDKLSIDHERQFIRASGILSPSVNDSLMLSLRDVHLGYVMRLLGVSSVSLDGSVTGDATVYAALGDMALNVNADATNFSVNDAILGDVSLRSGWDNTDKRLLIKGTISPQNAFSNEPCLDFSGFFLPTQDTLSFHANANSLPVSFMRRYLNGIIDSISGVARGKLDFYGSLKRPRLNGDIILDDASFSVGMLGTRYNVSDTIFIRPGAILLDNFEAHDEQGNLANVRGVINHKFFRDIDYDIAIMPEKLCVLSLAPSADRLYYGKAFATGRASIKGSPGTCLIAVNASTDPGTNVTLSLVSASSVTTSTSFLTYVDHSDTISASFLEENVSAPTPSATSVTVLLNIEANPNASIHLLTSDAGDELTATGSGTVTVRYDTKSGSATLGGLYEVESGRYTFTLEQIIQREFTLRQGGTIQFAGAPTAARVNVSAQYYLPSVSLLDILYDADLEGVARTNVPVNCLLNISGVLEHPLLSFGIELPSDEELQRKILNIVSSEEIMNREMLSLLVLGMFYRPDYVSSSSSTSASSSISNSMASMAASTVSGQLNQLLSQYTDKLSLGLNAHVGNVDQGVNQGGEYEVALRYAPNNRLVINSNLGYRNDYLYANTAADNSSTGSFIGDLDIEYKLTRSGRLRAKAYTHSADRYYYNVSGGAKTTQGVGLLYREDFNTWGGLLRRSFMSQAKRDSIDYVIRQRRNSSDQRLQNELQRQIREKRAADSLEARFDSLVSLTPRQF